MVLPAGELDATWEIVKEAVAAGKLPAARTRTGIPSGRGLDELYAILCVYARTSADEDSDQVRDEIRNLGIRHGLRFQQYSQISGEHFG